MTGNGSDAVHRDSLGQPRIDPVALGAPPGCRLLANEEAQDGTRRCSTVIWKAPNGSIGALVSEWDAESSEDKRRIIRIEGAANLSRLDRRLHWEITQREFVGAPAAPLLQSAAQALELVHSLEEASGSDH